MSADTSLEDLAKSYLDLRWHVDPVQATAAGLRDYDGRLGAFGADDVRQYLAAFKSVAASIEQHHPDSRDLEIDRTALLGDIRVAIYRLERERPHRRNPEFWLSHLLEGLYYLLAARDRSREHRARAAAARLRATPGFLDTARHTLHHCPPVFVDTASRVGALGLILIDQLATELVPDGDERFPETVRQARDALAAFLDQLPELAADDGTAPFAAGEKAFNFRVQHQHALRSTATELWRYGNRLVEEVEADLAQFARRIDRSVAWPDLVDRLRGDHPAAEQLVATYVAEMERARHFVEERGLAPFPVGDLDVVPTPSFLRPLIPFAAYQPPGLFSADRRGRFYVTPPDDGDPEGALRALRDHCVHEIPSTALHEGYPGHHLHLVTAQQQPSLIRRVVGTPLTIEGWALYCEEMMGEEGFYASPEQELFQRLAMLWRAVRIVLDVGLHTRGMTFERAVEILVDRVHFERGHAESEVRRYCAEPAYQLSYALGRRELRSLRDAYRAAAGPDYSLRRFHDAVLQYGALPVSLMRWGMRIDE